MQLNLCGAQFRDAAEAEHCLETAGYMRLPLAIKLGTDGFDPLIITISNQLMVNCNHVD